MFEWDDKKNQSNIEKHKISFDIAVEIFNDKLMHVSDKKINDEERCIAIGMVEGVILTVVFTYRGKKHRIISARRASKTERAVYYGNKK
jgi:uncharacterized DUF497 family protein